MKRVRERKEDTYRCQVCGMECVSRKMAQSNVPVTKTGGYGDNATPTPTAYADEICALITVSFTAETASDPAYLSDSQLGFADNHIQSNWSITIATTSGTNDGTYTIADRGVSRGTILLDDDDSLTTESAATAGEVTISKNIYKPNVTSGCPFCGSLNSKGD
jgi:hypothetical protein